MIRIKAAGNRWRRTFIEEDVLGLDDGRELINNNKINKSLTLKEQNSRSDYYNYFSNRSIQKRKER